MNLDRASPRRSGRSGSSKSVSGRTPGAILLMAIVATSSVVAGTALSHQGWEWIMDEPKYVDRVGVHCCSTDCFPAEASRFREDEGGISFDGQRLLRQERGIYWSQEPQPPMSQRWWVCRRYGKVKCIFKPQPES